MPTSIGDQKTIIFYEDYPVNKIRVGEGLAYPSGASVTYYVDSSLFYVEDVDSGESCLSPKTFVPKKDGWEFLGWKQDTVADGDILTSLTMDDSPFTLYAVFIQTVTISYYNGNTTKQTAKEYKYYNNGNIREAKFTISQASISGWTPRGWSTLTTANGNITYNTLNNTVITNDMTLYAMYQATITLTLYNNSASPTNQTGIRYYNSGSNATINPKFTATQASISGWTPRGWSLSSAGNGNISYGTISNTEFTSSTTLYGLYQQTITISYNSNGGSGSTSGESKLRYYSSLGTFVNPTFTLAANKFTRSYYTFTNWRLNGPSGTAYNVGASITLTANATMYAYWTAAPQPFTLSGSITTFTKQTVSGSVNWLNSYDPSTVSGLWYMHVEPTTTLQYYIARYTTGSFNRRGCSKFTIEVVANYGVANYKTIRVGNKTITLEPGNDVGTGVKTIDISDQPDDITVYIEVGGPNSIQIQTRAPQFS